MLKRVTSRRIKALVSNAGERVLRPHTMITAGKTPFRVIKDNGLVRLRHYERSGWPVKYRVPLVIVPPLAVNMLIYDWFPERSFVRYFLERGFDARETVVGGVLSCSRELRSRNRRPSVDSR